MQVWFGIGVEQMEPPMSSVLYSPFSLCCLGERIIKHEAIVKRTREREGGRGAIVGLWFGVWGGWVLFFAPLLPAAFVCARFGSGAWFRRVCRVASVSVTPLGAVRSVLAVSVRSRFGTHFGAARSLPAHQWRGAGIYEPFSEICSV